MKLIFYDRKQGERVIAKPSTVEECWKEMQQFLGKIGYISYYQRSRQLGDRIWVDFGSHHMFFYIEGISYEEFFTE